MRDEANILCLAYNTNARIKAKLATAQTYVEIEQPNPLSYLSIRRWKMLMFATTLLLNAYLDSGNITFQGLGKANLHIHTQAKST